MNVESDIKKCLARFNIFEAISYLLNISGARIAMFRKCPPLACAN
jgi:hypothetical protein